MKYITFLLLVLSFAGFTFSQTRTKPRATATPRPEAKAPTANPSIDKGTVSGRTYTNTALRFQVTFPDTWLIPGDDFEAYMKKQGFDLGLKAPDSLAPAAKAQINKALQNVTILLTAYRSMPGMADNAIARISIEDMSKNPQIKDAIDYLDAVRAAYAKLRLPADFKYSETQAEALASGQFGFLDVSTQAGKKRMYAVVRDGKAILFTLSYTNDEDLQTFRSVIGSGNFRVGSLPQRN